MNINIFKTFTLFWWQVSVFKIGLASVGILLALYFPKFFKGLKPVWWALAVFSISYIAIIWLPQ